MVKTSKDTIARRVYDPEIIDIPQEELNWSSVSLSEVLNSEARLEASVYNIEGRHAREILKKCKWELSSVCGDNGLATAYHRPRFKRIWVEKSPFPIYQPSQILEVYPKPSGYISEVTKTDIEALRVKKGQILLTCSGTIGNCSVVSKTLHNKIFSHDLIRIDCKDEIDIGYVYAFLKTKIGYTLINTNNYGAVVSHIEPEHLNNIPIPNPPNMLKKRIHELVMKSYELRDESNELLDKAEDLLIGELELPPIDDFKPDYFDTSSNVKNYSVKFSELNNRFEATYHVPIVRLIIKHLKKSAKEVTTIGDKRITKKIILPGRFKRVYVEEGQGIVFFSGKNIMELDPSDKKYLSFSQHESRIREHLTIHHNMILVTCSGTVGKVTIVPKHWDNWAMTHDIIRLLPVKGIEGFLYIWLQTDFAKTLMEATAYGSVVPHIEISHIAKIPVPILRNSGLQAEINHIALEANEMRYKAYKLEQQALAIVNEEVIHKR